MQTTPQRSQLFVASCLALLVTSLSFGIRAGILGRLGVQFELNAGQLGTIAATAFWGFPLAVIIGGFVVDVIGMKRLLIVAFVFHLAGILLTVFAGGYWSLFISTLCIGIANGTVEAACNPLVATIYADNKTTKLNHFHLWFPGGIVIGTLLVYFLDKAGIGWQIQVGLMAIPTLIYGFLFSKLEFPVTERVASGVSAGEMYKALLSPLFIVMIILMFGTAITELFTGQWIDVLLKNVSDNAILLLTIETGIMVIGRGFAGPVVHRFSPTGVLLISAILSAVGLYLLGHSSGNMLFVGAIIFGMGVCYFWPTMLGFVSENLPKTGAVGMNLMGGAGMFAVSVYTVFMGEYYDQLVSAKLPAGDTSDAAMNEAKKLAGPEVLNATLIIPVVLSVAFAILLLYMRGRKQPSKLSAA
ncbi:MAG: MFS transporter [Chitinophagaceae bacterium]|nr:MFS transporter [Chitinophagaceae bacterium]MCA6452853.1 MFS transporter [Chitinophagaceae bacterium]MCA6455069.1 MFS transporter [Chitinophagaceae bacterium]MCA6458851.1 MFS transporter [Chitinophagaceae bacterium]MCA6464359.1 MFS transporter [Chitinophagaceae bacterium]